MRASVHPAPCQAHPPKPVLRTLACHPGREPAANAWATGSSSCERLCDLCRSASSRRTGLEEGDQPELSPLVSSAAALPARLMRRAISSRRS